MQALAEAEGFPTLVEGSNVDDLEDYRPGMAAIQELGVESPLVDVGLTKTNIRALSAIWDCLPGTSPVPPVWPRESATESR